MSGIITGFAIIAFIIVVGVILGRTGVARQEDRITFNRLAFFAATPSLLFTVLAKADVAAVFSALFLIHAMAVGILLIGGAALMRALGTTDRRQLAVAAFSGVYSNANNIGLPVAVYIVGEGSYVAPILVLQLVVMAPLLVGILDALGKEHVNFWHVLKQPFVNPIVLGAALGVVFSVLSLPQPDWLMRPLELMGGAAVPLMLTAFGISLVGQKPLQPGTGRRVVLIATVIKVVAMPALVYLLGRWGFALGEHDLFAATVLAALPSAQNMYQYALRYNSGEIVARDTVLLTTLLMVPIVMLIALLLHPLA